MSKNKIIAILILLLLIVSTILTAGYLNQRSLRKGDKFRLDQINDTLSDLRDDYSSLVSLYSELEIVADSVKGIANERKFKIERMEAEYSELVAVHNIVIDSIKTLHDSLLIPKLYAQLGYIEDTTHKAVLIRMPAIRDAVVKIQEREHCMEQLTEMTELYYEAQGLINNYESLISYKDMMLHVADSMNVNLADQLHLTQTQRDIYKKDSKRQKAVKWVYLGLAGLVTGIAIIK